MKASRAYIAGLGTSGVLIGSFLLLLMVGSAIVAFRGAPGEASNDGLDRLDVTHPGQASRAARSPLRSAAWAERDAARRDRSRARYAGRVRDPGRAAGRVRGGRSTGRGDSDLVSGVAGGRSAAADESVAGTGGHGGLPRLPGQAPQQGGTPSAPSVGGVADDVGSAVEQTSRGLGETVGEAPSLPGAVTGPGETVGGAVEQAAPVIDETASGVTGTVDGVTEDVTGATGELPATTPP